MAYPDVLGLLIAYLDGLHTVPVASRVPDPRPAEWIQVRQIGGFGLPPVRDVARFDVFYWGPDEPTAHGGGLAVRGQIQALAAPGGGLSGVPVYRVEEVLQRQWDDPLTGAPAWWATYAITLHATSVLPR